MSITTIKKHDDPTKTIMNRLEVLEGVEVAFGWIDNPEAATIAGFNHFGNPIQNLAPRDVLTPTAANVETTVREVTKNAGDAAARGKDPKGEIDALESTLEQALQQSIRDFSDPPNRPSTIAQKGFDNPLIGKGDGGRILRHAQAKVRPREN